MTTRQRSRSRRSSRGARVPTRWENLAFLHSHTAAASAVFSDITVEPVLVNSVGTATILRSIIHVDIVPTGGAPGDVGTVAYGIAVVTKDAVVGAVLPDPLGDFEQGWYWWAHRFFLMDPTALTTNSFDVDIRTMRKLRGGYRLVLISDTPANPQALTTTITMRNLWRVP